jgi:hypothetical protein
MKVFISYSHKDEEFKDELVKHLSLLKRNGAIETWHDRCIHPSEDFENAIDDNIRDSQIILLLISSDFLASDYCCQKELELAIQQHDQNKSRIVQVILRSCDWKDLETSKYQALPKDAIPVANWPRSDDAWLNVVNGIKTLIISIKNNDSILPTIYEDRAIEDDSYSSLQPSFIERLLRTEITFQHNRKDNINLSDIFIYPDLRKKSYKIEKIDDILNSEIILEQGKFIWLSGDEQVGKTALCNMLYLKSITEKNHPILVNGSEVNSSDFGMILKREIGKQYQDEVAQKIMLNDDFTVIIDDYDKIKLNKRFQEKLLDNISSAAKNVVLISPSTYELELNETNFLKGYSKFEILLFGNEKRTELIEKWISLGQEEVIDDEALFKQTDIKKIHVDSFVRKNIVPPKPIFILSILQILETITPNDHKPTSYGHCYNHLIISLLSKTNISIKETPKYLNYITELSYFFYKNDDQYLDEAQINNFRIEYSENYLSVNHLKTTSDLISCGILRQSEKGIVFNYKYIYYYFVSKYISDHFHNDKALREIISKMIDNLHNEVNANILIFITYHLKDPKFLEEIQLSMMEVFENEKEACLTIDELSFLNELMGVIPKLIVEQKDIREERRRNQRELDKREENENNFEEEVDEDNDIFKSINKTFKSMEVIGHIVRNQHDSLKKHLLIDLTEDACAVGLRFLKYFLGISEKYKKELTEFIKDILVKNPTLSEGKIEEEATSYYLYRTYRMIYAIIRQISLSVGSSEVIEIYDELIKKVETPAMALVSASVELLFSEELDITKLKKSYEGLEGNVVARRIFREFIVQHIYLYKVSSPKKRTSIANLFSIPIKSQLLIESKRETKK